MMATDAQHDAAPIGAVIFDNDGTLVDSEALGFEAILAEARPYGVTMTVQQALALIKGQSMTRCIELLGEQAGRALPDGFIVQARAAMAQAFRTRLQPMAGALAMLHSLTVPFAVASNGPREKIELTLALTGLLPLFEGRVFSAFDVGKFKPDPGLFLHAAHALGVPPHRCAIVEDSVAGARAGLAAGMRVYVLASGQALPPDLAAQVHTIGELAELTTMAWNR